MTTPAWTILCSLALAVGTLGSGCATDVETTQIDDDLGTCKPHCEKCHPGDVCSELCTYPEHCQQACAAFELCIIGYTWDANACKCLPS